MSSVFKAYNGEYNMTAKDEELLSYLRDQVNSKSGNGRLKDEQRKRNKEIPDPVTSISLIYGMKNYTFAKFRSFMEKGILCAEFLDIKRETQAHFHVECFLSGANSMQQFMSNINKASTSILSGDIYSKMKINNFVPGYGRRSTSITFVINPTSNWEYMLSTQKYQSALGKKYTKSLSDIQVSILAGIPSTEISAIIVGDSVNHAELAEYMRNNARYMQIYNTLGQKMY